MFSREEVLKIAKLARLELSDAEVELYQGRLGRVLDYIRELSELKTPADAFVRHVPADAQTMRADEAQSFPAIDDLLKNAPQSEQNHFLMPTIVEHS